MSQGGSPDDVSDGTIGFPGSRARRGLRAIENEDKGGSSKIERLLKDSPSFSSHYKHAANIQRQQRLTQGFDTAPTAITSVTFLEFDADVDDIINQDSTYFDTFLAETNVISFRSISSTLDPTKPLRDQMDLVPGGVMLVMFGYNADNQVVQNTVAWAYDLTQCSEMTMDTTSSIGWIGLEDYTPPRSVFCPGVTDQPTLSPVVPVGLEAKQTDTAPPLAKSSKNGAKSAKNDDSKSKSSKLFAKAAKLFKSKAAKLSKDDVDSGDASAIDDGTNSTAVVDGGKMDDAKAGKLNSKASKKASSNTKTAKIDSKVGTIQVSRPDVPRPQMPALPITSPSTGSPVEANVTSLTVSPVASPDVLAPARPGDIQSEDV